jgi:3-deoxy-7-phosphoheptulonate synthase
MGVYTPRTSPYDLQGLGKACLPWLFEMAGRHGIRVIAIEVTDPRQIQDVHRALEGSGPATGVMLQIGTRNAQNFELLREVGQQRTFPVLCERGMGITLEESLNACEYIASAGNRQIVFCLRGVASHLGEPHGSCADFALVPVVRRQTRLPVFVDPSHAVGRTFIAFIAPDGHPDIVHAAAQGVVAGAAGLLVDLHPDPARAACDGHQALGLDHLPVLLDHARRVRAVYEQLALPAPAPA